MGELACLRVVVRDVTKVVAMVWSLGALKAAQRGHWMVGARDASKAKLSVDLTVECSALMREGGSGGSMVAVLACKKVLTWVEGKVFLWDVRMAALKGVLMEFWLGPMSADALVAAKAEHWDVWVVPLVLWMVGCLAARKGVWWGRLTPLPTVPL